jgi:Flp pilus assembly protein TadD
MTKYLIVLGALAALHIYGGGISTSVAKPPDLPVELRIDFDDSEPQTAPAAANSAAANSATEAKKDDGPHGSFFLGLDFFSGKFSFHWQTLQKALTPRQQEARALFDIAERCQKNGDRDMARTCYEEAHLLAPQTDFGRLAIQRLSELDK